MSGMKLLKFGVPIANAAMQTSSKVLGALVRHQTGSCGIEPFKPPEMPPPPPPKKFPDHLLRPPCLPGSERGRFPPDCHTFRGYYCPTEKIKYTFPPFSENIDFVPSGEVECWWAKPRKCEFHDMDDNVPIKL